MNDTEKTRIFANALLRDRFSAFQEEFPDEKERDLRNLLFFAINRCHLIQTMDWTGKDEDEDGGAPKFFNQLLQGCGIDPIRWDYDELERISFESGRGEYPPLMFKTVDRELRKVGQRVVLISFGGGDYLYSILSEDEFESVRYFSWNEDEAFVYGAEDFDAWNELIAKLKENNPGFG